MGKKELEEKTDILFKVKEVIEKEISGSFPDQKTRDLVKNLLLEKASFLDGVKCDEENNPPEVVDDEVIIAKCIWESKNNGSFKSINLVFGNEERAFKYLFQ